jgi:hypothetical protein
VDMAISLHPSCQLGDGRWRDEHAVHHCSAQPTMRASIRFPDLLFDSHAETITRGTR